MLGSQASAAIILPAGGAVERMDGRHGLVGCGIAKGPSVAIRVDDRGAVTGAVVLVLCHDVAGRLDAAASDGVFGHSNQPVEVVVSKGGDAVGWIAALYLLD